MGVIDTRRRSQEEVRREIARAREDVQTTALALRQKVDAMTSIDEWVRKHPLEIVGAAFALGLIVGYRTG